MKIQNLRNEDLRFTDFETKKNKKGEEFHIMKVYTENANGKSRPIILDKETTTLGLRKVLDNNGKISRLYFPITFIGTDEDFEWIDKFEEITNFIEAHVKKVGVGEGVDFSKFNPLKSEPGESPVMFLRVGYYNKKVFCNFYGENRNKRLTVDFMLNQPFDVDVKIKIDSIFVNSKNAYLQVSLTEATVAQASRFRRVSESEDE